MKTKKIKTILITTFVILLVFAAALSVAIICNSKPSDLTFKVKVETKLQGVTVQNDGICGAFNLSDKSYQLKMCNDSALFLLKAETPYLFIVKSYTIKQSIFDRLYMISINKYNLKRAFDNRIKDYYGALEDYESVYNLYTKFDDKATNEAAANSMRKHVVIYKDLFCENVIYDKFFKDNGALVIFFIKPKTNDYWNVIIKNDFDDEKLKPIVE